MKINSKISYPYPIWGWSDDYTIEINDTDIDIQQVEDKEDFVFDLDLSAHNPDIEKLIIDGYAVYACSVDCSSTFYHDFISSTNAKFQIRIPRKSVNKKVEIKWMIVAQKAIINFQSTYLNEDYGGHASFPKGAMLAYITSFEIYPELSGELHTYDDLFIVVRNNVSDDIDYRLDNDKIAIALPPAQLEIFNSAAGQRFANVLHATIVEQSLIFAILNISDYLERPWAQIISQYIDALSETSNYGIPSWESVENGEEKLTIKHALEIVKYVLREPVKRMFCNIRTVNAEIESFCE